MKRLYMIAGPMGVGKTAVSRELQKRLSNCVFLDGDWCWDSDPFIVTSETKALVTDNIIHMLNNFLKCSAYENVVFCWVMHEREIIDNIIGGLDLADCEVRICALICSEDELKSRLQNDISAGVRKGDVTERAVERLGYYGGLGIRLIDTTNLTVSQAAEEVLK